MKWLLTSLTLPKDKASLTGIAWKNSGRLNRCIYAMSCVL